MPKRIPPTGQLQLARNKFIIKAEALDFPSVDDAVKVRDYLQEYAVSKIKQPRILKRRPERRRNWLTLPLQRKIIAMRFGVRWAACNSIQTDHVFEPLERVGFQEG